MRCTLLALFHRIKNSEQFCGRNDNGRGGEMLCVPSHQIRALFRQGDFVKHHILGIGKYFFRLSPFQGEAFLKNHIQDGINQRSWELELGPGKDITITTYTISCPPESELFLC